MKISACIITLNEERNLPRCLQSVAPLVDEILIVDSGSTDATPEIAAKFSARVVQQNWLGYVGQKNFALEQAAHSWVLSIDADEEISPGLAEAIARVKADPAANAPGAPNGYQFSRIVFYRKKWVRHGDWYPDRLVRLFRPPRGALHRAGACTRSLKFAARIPSCRGIMHHFTYEDAFDRKQLAAPSTRSCGRKSAHERRKRAYPWSGAAACTRAARQGLPYQARISRRCRRLGCCLPATRAKVWLKYDLLRKLNRGR